jgi:hypothetical protein
MTNEEHSLSADRLGTAKSEPLFASHILDPSPPAGGPQGCFLTLGPILNSFVLSSCFFLQIIRTETPHDQIIIKPPYIGRRIIFPKNQSALKRRRYLNMNANFWVTCVLCLLSEKRNRCRLRFLYWIYCTFYCKNRNPGPFLVG